MFAVGGTGDVALYGDGLAVLLGDFVGGFFCGALVEVDCDDTRSFAGAVQCGLAADARAGTGNKDDFVRESQLFSKG